MSAPRDTILVAGSANLDFVVRAPHVPRPGETVLGRDFAIFPGGKGANQAVACARAGGARTTMLLALGADNFAPILEESLLRSGVQLHIVRVARSQTGVALICLGDSAENAITVAPGANAALTGSELPPLDEVRGLLLQLETPIEAVTAFARKARASDVKVVLNAAPGRALPDELLRLIDVLVVNEEELVAVAGSHGTIAEVLASVDVPCAIVTLGARGSCAVQGGRFFLQPAFRVEAVDTTGAGDAFCGVLIAALCTGADLPQALRRASAAAALATTKLGAQESIPMREEVERLLSSKADAADGALEELASYCGLPASASASAASGHAR